MTLRFAAASSKGGVGKTTITVNTAHSMVPILRAKNPDARILIVDADTQAGATQLLTGHRFTDTDPTVSTLLTERHSLNEVILRLEDSAEYLVDDEIRSAYAGIDLIPACHEGKIRVNSPEEFWSLRDVLDESPLPHDVILLDCGYGDSDLNTLAIIAADHILAITSVTLLGMNGVAQVMEKVAKMRRSFPHMRISGVIANDYSATETADQQMLQDMQEQLGQLLWEPPIPRRALIKRSQLAGLPVGMFKVKSARELVDRYTAIAHRMLSLEETR